MRSHPFQANWIELVLFLSTAYLLTFSLYTLIEQPSAFPLSLKSPALRFPATLRTTNALQPTFLATMDLPCQAQFSTQTTAKKIRFISSNCWSTEQIPLQMLKLIHTNTHQEANVFFNPQQQSFSTDYLSLIPGINLLQVEGILQDGQRWVQTVTVSSEFNQPLVSDLNRSAF